MHTERVGGLTVHAFMLINKFLTSQHLTESGGGLYFISGIRKENA